MLVLQKKEPLPLPYPVEAICTSFGNLILTLAPLTLLWALESPTTSLLNPRRQPETQGLSGPLKSPFRVVRDPPGARLIFRKVPHFDPASMM